MIELQVTLFDTQNRYKPVSTIVKVESIAYFNEHQREVKLEAMKKICLQRYWTGKDLKKYGYTTCKIRVYDKERIARENKERYEKIKEERGWNKKKKTLDKPTEQ